MKTLRFVQFIYREIYYKANHFKGYISKNTIKNPYQVVEVPIDKINYSISPTPYYNLDWLEGKKISVPEVGEVLEKNHILCVVRITGKIKSGDWDLKKVKFIREIPYVAFKQFFEKKVPWNKTVYYEAYKRRLKDFSPRGSDNSWNDFKKNALKKHEMLCKKIKNEGYKSQKEIDSNLNTVRSYEEKKVINEINIGVGREGELLFIDGRHRLSIVKILKIKKIPVIVNVWHKEFIEKVKKKTGLNENKITPEIAIKYIK